MASKLRRDLLACLGVEDTTCPGRPAAVEGAGQSEPQVGEAFLCRFQRAPDVSQLDHGRWSCAVRARMQRLPVVTVDVKADEGRERRVGVGALQGGDKFGYEVIASGPSRVQTVCMTACRRLRASYA